MSISRFLPVFVGLVLASCGDDDTSNGNTPPIIVIPSPMSSPTPTPGVGTISGQGGTVALQGVATVTIPAGTFDRDTNVRVTQMSTAKTSPDFAEVTGFLSVDSINDSSVLVTLSSTQPKKSVRLMLVAPTAYVSAVPSGKIARILAATVTSGEQEGAYNTWEVLPVIIDPATSSISLDVDPVYFAQVDPQGRQIGVFTLVFGPGSR